MNPNTFKTSCQALLIPKRTSLPFIWDDRAKLKSSNLWSKIVTLLTCPKNNPQRGLLEVIGNNIPIDIQIKSHGAKFYIKNRLQPQDDQVYNHLEHNKSQIVGRLAADDRMFGSLTSYTQDSLKALIYRRWNNRLKNLTSCSTWL